MLRTCSLLSFVLSFTMMAPTFGQDASVLEFNLEGGGSGYIIANFTDGSSQRIDWNATVSLQVRVEDVVDEGFNITYQKPFFEGTIHFWGKAVDDHPVLGMIWEFDRTKNVLSDGGDGFVFYDPVFHRVDSLQMALPVANGQFPEPYLIRLNSSEGNGPDTLGLNVLLPNAWLFDSDLYRFAGEVSFKRPRARISMTPINPVVNEPVSFDGSISSDDDGVIVSHTWEFGDGASAQGAMAEHTYTSAGDYTVTLTVDDDDGFSDTQTRGITVRSEKERPIAAFVYSVEQKTGGYEVTFDGSGSIDRDGEITGYLWDLGAAELSREKKPIQTFDGIENPVVELTVFDDEGLQHSIKKTICLEQPCVAVTGVVKNVMFTGEMFANAPMLHALVELYEAGMRIDSTFSAEDGRFHFDEVENATGYEIRVSAVLQSGASQGEKVVGLRQNGITTAEMALSELPYALVGSIYNQLDYLGDRKYGFGKIASGLDVFELLDQWIADVEADDRIQPSLKRLRLALLGLEEMYPHGLELSVEAMTAFLAPFFIIDSTISLQKDLLRSLDQLSYPVLQRFVLEGLLNLIILKYSGYLIDLLFNQIEAIQPEYGGAFQTAKEILKAVITVQLDPTRQLTAELFDTILQTAIEQAAVFVFMQTLYVPEFAGGTQRELDESIINAGSLVGEGTITDASNRVLEVIRKGDELKTDALDRSASLRDAGNLTNVLSDVLMIAATPLSIPLIVALNAVMKSISLSYYATAATITTFSFFEIRDTAVPLVTAGAFASNGTSKFNDTANDHVKLNAEMQSHVEAFVNVSGAYNEQVKAVIALIKEERKEEAFVEIEQLIRLEEAVSLETQAAHVPVYAAAINAFNLVDGFDDTYTEFGNIALASQFERLQLYALLAQYAGDESLDADALTEQAVRIEAAFEDEQSQLEKSLESVQGIAALPVLRVTQHGVIDQDSASNPEITIRATVRNTSDLSVDSVTVLMAPDSSAALVTDAEIHFEQLGPGEEVDVNWVLVVADSAATGGYQINLDGRNALGLSSSGLYTVRQQIVATSNSQPDIASPREAQLGQNYPNPFTGTTVIPFELDAPAHVRIEVFNVLGQSVEKIIDAIYPAGRHSVRFEPSSLSPGVYYYRMSAGFHQTTRRMVRMQ